MHKKYFASALLVLAVSAHTLAQERSWFVGIKGGVTLPGISLGTSEALTGIDLNTEPIVRYTGGLAVQYFIEKNFGLQVEFNYVQRGWRQDFSTRTIPDPIELYEVLLDYAEVPIMAHAYLGRKNLRLFINGGIYVSYLLNHKTNRANVDEEEIDILYDPRFQNEIDFGVRGGGGFEVVTAIGMFQAEGSFSWGINSIVEKDLAEIPNIVQNLSPAVTLGYYVAF